MFSINVARKKAADHPLALKTEAEWDKNEFWGIFPASLVAMMPNVETAAPSRGSSDASMLSCCPKSSWPDGKAAVFLLCGQFNRPCWGSWVLAGGGWGILGHSAAPGHRWLCFSRREPVWILGHSGHVSISPRCHFCISQRSSKKFALQLSDVSWKRAFSRAGPPLAPLARLLLGKRGFGIHLSRTMAPF